jgi:hypothetical protein
MLKVQRENTKKQKTKYRKNSTGKGNRSSLLALNPVIAEKVRCVDTTENMGSSYILQRNSLSFVEE